MNRKIPAFLLEHEQHQVPKKERTHKIKLSFIDRTLNKSAAFIKSSVISFESSKTPSVFHFLSAPILLILFIIYVVCIGLTHTIKGQLIFMILFFILVLFSSVNKKHLYRNALTLSFLFGFLVMVPASVNIITPGKIVLTIYKMSAPKMFFVYQIPATTGITYEGILIVTRMYLKVLNSLTLSFFILSTIPFGQLIKSLRILRVPGIFILIITLSYKYIFIMAYTVEEMYLALKSRWIRNFDGEKTRNIITGRIGLLFKKSWLRYEETYRAMISRGFTGNFMVSETKKITIKEALVSTIFIGVAIAICLL
jgi:cobalt/nickel transport system permease protein